MDAQQIAAWSIVAAAAFFLLRNFWRSLRAFREGAGGCSEGCGKCAGSLAPPARLQKKDVILLSERPRKP